MTGDKSAQIEALRREAAGCRACPLWQNATQTVFGEGPAEADILFLASSRATGKIAPVIRSWGPPGSCSTRRSKRRASIASEPRH